jgi:flavin reductase (DIM6/NTAB) family NADH-FMN oxidoreductase RutF
MGHFATGLTVITASTEDGLAGLTCQSFSSLSLEPPLVSFSPARTSTTWPLLRRAGRFTVNILSAEHQHLGNPILDQALAWVDCELQQEYDGGDHTIVVAAVRALNARADAEPLLFYRGDFIGLRARANALESVA